MPNSVELTAPPGFWENTSQLYKRLVDQLYASTEYLGMMEQFNVTERTPELIGALRSDISYEANHNSGDELLAFIYASTSEQEAEYGREYDIYQEGAALGLATYTNDPHEMFARIMTDDIPAIERWGMDALQHELDSIAAGVTP